MDWSAPVDAYCERLDPTFWAEPLNAASNLSFIVAAIVAARYAGRRGALDVALGVLVGVLVAIGVGSFLFHTVATRWAGIADVVPIQLFIVLYFFLAMRRFAGFSLWLASGATAAFVLASYLGGGAARELFGDSLNGSEGYLPPLAGLLVVGALLVVAGRAGAGRALVTGALLFAVSLTFRTLDASICPGFPPGTHFLWHLLNGVLLGYLIIALVRHGRVHPRTV